jgi:Putative transmembrane protein (Alph_Pro_TM).
VKKVNNGFNDFKMKKMLQKNYKISILFIIVFLVKQASAETYFDLSENNIKIETDFVGKEIIIYGILNDDQETLITIKGPEKIQEFKRKREF